MWRSQLARRRPGSSLTTDSLPPCLLLSSPLHHGRRRRPRCVFSLLSGGEDRLALTPNVPAAAIRSRRLAQLQSQGGGGGGPSRGPPPSSGGGGGEQGGNGEQMSQEAQQQKQRAEEEQLRTIMSTLLEPAARERSELSSTSPSFPPSSRSYAPSRFSPPSLPFEMLFTLRSLTP